MAVKGDSGIIGFLIVARRRARRRNKTLREHNRKRSRRPGFEVLDLLLSLSHHFSVLFLLVVDSFVVQNERRGVLDVEPLVLGWFFWGSFGLDCMGCGRRESNVRDDKEEEEEGSAKELLQYSIETHESREIAQWSICIEKETGRGRLILAMRLIFILTLRMLPPYWCLFLPACLMLTLTSSPHSFSDGLAKGANTSKESIKDGRRLNTDPIWLERQQKVKEAFIHAWSGYKKYAMGYDELVPLSQRGVDGLGGLGATSMDALDTAMIMGANEVVSEAGSWIETHLSNRIAEKGQVNLFDTAIRVLGGLLSAYHLSGGEQGTKSMHEGPKPIFYLETARNLADCLLVAFTSSPTPIPFSDVVLHDSAKHCAPDGLAVLQKFQLFSWSGVQLSQYHFW
ncbi:hypothetical protein GH714_042038 [Hevea brasiliensis]|uniref:alpha-1,2-Mannosidase n=1 Tax=Hevea brasiliensis TaxID=3981 RepID=A0A6A6MUF1_HEVBR|nr:hypothetical protein GH714_042038 [Hevea brasiliensis]